MCAARGQHCVINAPLAVRSSVTDAFDELQRYQMDESKMPVFDVCQALICYKRLASKQY